MNHKHIFVALMAILSGSGLGNCQAMQTEANSAFAIGSGVVRPAQPGPQGGSSGAVKSAAMPLKEFGTSRTLPPIVGPTHVEHSRTKQNSTLPPIITNSNDAQLRNQQVSNQQAATAPKPPVKQKSTMLAPLAPTTKSETPWATSSVARAPAPVIQASGPVADPRDDQQVKHATQWGPEIKPKTGLSSAGVPLYPAATAASYTQPQEVLPPVVAGSLHPPHVNSGPGSIPMPPVIYGDRQMASPAGQNVAPAPYAPSSVMVDPAYGSPAYVEPPMNPTYFDSAPMEAPVISTDCGCGQSNCSSCGGGQAYDNCNACGGGGCSDCGVASSSTGYVSGCQSCGADGCFDQSQVDANFGASGSVGQARRYLIGDIMYFDRYDGVITESNFGGLNNFEENAGWRVIFGRRDDATRGQEFTYMGTDTLEESLSVTDAGGRITLALALRGGFADTEMTAFRNAVSQTQIKTTEFQSIEFNRVRLGWDVVKTFIGLRYIYVEDDYAVASENFFGETGLFEVSTRNNLIGPHIGGEMFYDVGYRLSWSAGTKWGIYANPNRVDTRLLNAGVQFLDLENDTAQFSQSIELNLNGHYQITQNTRFRFGYTALFLFKVAEATDNIPFILNPTSGSNTDDSGEITFQAVSVGFEIYR